MTALPNGRGSFKTEAIMVYLSRIYTKTGDQGDTGLGDGSRVPKDHPRVTAYGTVDELNSILGIFLVHLSDAAMTELIRSVQNDLFDVGADLCLPSNENEKPGQVLRVRAEQAERLEKMIDHYNERLQPLRSFILPGGTQAAAWCHLARTVCRRAERDVVTLAHSEKVNPQVIVYLNRLSDLLFVLGRVCNQDGRDDVLWVPGGAKQVSGAFPPSPLAGEGRNSPDVHGFNSIQTIDMLPRRYSRVPTRAGWA